MQNTAIFIKIARLIAIFLYLGTGSVAAQGLEWFEAFGNNKFTQGEAVTTDQNNNIYFVGDYVGGIDFDPGPGKALIQPFEYSSDCFVQKLDANRNLIWVKRLSGTGAQYPQSVSVDADGNVLVAGYFYGATTYTTDTTTTVTAKGKTDIFVFKMDSNGKLLWFRSFGGASTSQYEITKSVLCDGQNNVYLSGNFSGTADFDPGPNEFKLYASVLSSFVVKLSANGKLVWASTLPGSSTTTVADMALDPTGYLYIAGNLNGKADFDPSPDTLILTSQGTLTDGYLQKLDTAGHLIWARTLGAEKQDGPTALALDPAGNLYVGGTFYGTIDFDPGPDTVSMTSNAQQFYLLKLRPNGDFSWVKYIGQMYEYAIRADKYGAIYTTGWIASTIDADPGPGVFYLHSTGPLDVFLSKFDTAGNFVNALRFGGNDLNFVHGFGLDQEGNPLICGRFKGADDFDPGPGFNIYTTYFPEDYAFLIKVNERWNFQGIVFNDLNNNQLQDAGEPGIPGIIIQALNRPYYATTEDTGAYHLYTYLVGDTIRPVLPHPYWSVTPTYALPDSNQTPMHFAVHIPPGIHDAALYALVQGSFRPGLQTTIKVHARNPGTAVLLPVRVVVRSDAFLQNLQLIDAIPAWTTIAGDSLVWQIDALPPGADTLLILHVKTGNTLPFGTPIELNFSITDALDADTTNNKAQIIRPVSAAYDPNDKLVNPPKVYTAYLDQTRLQYLIRFQNTGNAAAKMVTIHDTLDARLNAASLEVLGASHPFTWRLQGPNLLEFDFAPINLPDSSSNFEASQGYVAFSVLANRDLQGGDSVRNRAGIYFDYNLPVITHYADSKVVKSIVDTYLPPADAGPAMLLLPNPVASLVPAEIRLNFEADQILIYDVSGKLVYQCTPAVGARTIQVPGLTSGAYWVNARNGKQSVTKLWMVMRP